MSISAFNTPADPPIPRGSERFLWWAMQPRSSGNNGYLNVRGSLDASGQLPGIGTGSAGSYGMAYDPAIGWFRRHQGVTNAAPAYVTTQPFGLMRLPPRMDQVSAFAPPFAEVLIFRELLRSFASGPLPAGHALMHGFTLIGNLLAGFPQLGAGSWRGIAITERQSDVVLAVKNANPATLIPLPGVSLSAAFTLVEHRLYAPTAGRIGRYELWLNESLAATVNGDHPNFPHPVVAADGWGLMFMSLNNAGTATTAGFRALWGEIILGPDSDGTF